MVTKLFVWWARARLALSISLGMLAACAVDGLGSKPSDGGWAAGDFDAPEGGFGESPIAEVGGATQGLVRASPLSATRPNGRFDVGARIHCLHARFARTAFRPIVTAGHQHE